MRNKIIGILMTLGLISSCQNKEKKGNSSEPENNVNIEFTDDNGKKISKAELENSTGTFNYKIYGIDSASGN